MELYPDRRPSGTYWKIRESYYEDGKVKKRNVLYLGAAEKIFERWTQPTLEDAELATVSFAPAAALRWAFEDLGLDGFFTDLLDPEGKHSFPAWKKVFLLVWRRFFQNMSMREAIERYSDQVFPFWWREDVPTVQRLYQFLKESLDECTLESAQVELARRALDGSSIETCHLDTTNYCTFAKDDTKYLRIGRSKQGVVGRRLVGLALALSEDATPVLSHAYPGNRHDSTIFPEFYSQVCNRLEAVASDLENITLIFDRGFDDEDNFDLAWESRPHVVAGVKRNRKPVKEIIDGADLREFEKAFKTSFGKCYVREAGRAEMGKHWWRIVLSYHDTTREKTQKRMKKQRRETEDLLTDLKERAERKGPGRPITEDGIEGELKNVLKGRYGCLDWSFDPETRQLQWDWNDEWDRHYDAAGIHAIITDRDDWPAGEVVETYFRRKNLEKTFHLNKDALVVPVEPPYVKEDHLIRAHLFLIFVGLLCYRHIRRKLPDDMTEEDVKYAMERLEMVVAAKNGSVHFKLANVDKRTTLLLRKLELEEYLPD